MTRAGLGSGFGGGMSGFQEEFNFRAAAAAVTAAVAAPLGEASRHRRARSGGRRELSISISSSWALRAEREIAASGR